MSSAALDRAGRVYRAKRLALGYQRIWAWFQPFAVRRLDELALIYGSRTAALEACVLAHVVPEDVEENEMS